MDTILSYIKAAFILLGGLLSWMIGKFDSLLYALIAFVVIDYITGVLIAILRKKISSSVGYKGIFRKVCIFSMVQTRDFIFVPLCV